MLKLPSYNSRVTVATNGNQYATIDFIKLVALKSKNEPFVQNFINYHKITPDFDGVKKLFNLIFENVKFEADEPNIQTIRTPRRLFLDGVGNCVDYTTSLAAFLLYLKIPFSIVMVSNDPRNPANFNHVYIRAFFNLTLDLVLGQSQDGTEKLKRKHERVSNFGSEAPYYKKLEFSIYD